MFKPNSLNNKISVTATVPATIQMHFFGRLIKKITPKKKRTKIRSGVVQTLTLSLNLTLFSVEWFLFLELFFCCMFR